MLTLGWATSTASSSTGTNRMITFFVYLFNQSDFLIYIFKNWASTEVYFF